MVRVRLRDGVDAHGWLVEGGEYAVIGIEGEDSKVRYRVIGEAGRPALYDPSSLDVVAEEVPKGWIFRVLSNGWELQPYLVSSPNFWVRYYDSEREAILAFEQVAAELNAAVTSEEAWR